jgi:hypothetical protein
MDPEKELKMKRSLSSIFFSGLLALALVGCSTAPTSAPAEKKVEPKAAAAPVTGQSAIFSMYQVARQWSGDSQLLKIENIPLADVKPEAGKYGAWRGSFVSIAKGRVRSYTYSVVEVDASLHKGVFAGEELPYIKNPQVFPFFIQDVKTDTPAALETATKESAEFLKKSAPDTPVQYALEHTALTPKPAWRVIWGASVSQSNYSVYIDATTGKFIKKTR